MSGLEPKPRKGWYYANGTVDGQRVRKSLGTRDKRQAEEQCALIEARIWKSHNYGNETVVTFEEAALDYMESGGESRFLASMLHHFKGVRLSDIKPGDVRAAARQLYPQAAAATRNRQVLTPVRAVINHAADRGWCPSIKIRSFKITKPVRVAVDSKWISAFVDTANAANPRQQPYLAAIALFMWQNGARVSEACRVTPDDLDTSLSVIVLRETKNGEPRPAHITRQLAGLLSTLPPRRGRMFGYVSRHSVRNAWISNCEKAGIPYVSPHQAGRHSFATENVVNRGLNAKTVGEAGGWKSTRLLMDTYVHDPNAGRTIADAYDADLTQPPTGSNIKALKSK